MCSHVPCWSRLDIRMILHDMTYSKIHLWRTCAPTLYTVMGLSSLKVRFLAGLELYLHLDSTNFSRASRATSSDIVGTLEEQHKMFNLSKAQNYQQSISERRWLIDVCVTWHWAPKCFCWVQAGGCRQGEVDTTGSHPLDTTSTQTQKHRRWRLEQVEEKRKENRRLTSIVALVSVNVFQPASRGSWRSLLWYVRIKWAWSEEAKKRLFLIKHTWGWRWRDIYLLQQIFW